METLTINEMMKDQSLRSARGLADSKVATVDRGGYEPRPPEEDFKSALGQGVSVFAVSHYSV